MTERISITLRFLVTGTFGPKLLPTWEKLSDYIKQELLETHHLLFLGVLSAYRKEYGTTPSFTALRAYLPMSSVYTEATLSSGADLLRTFNAFMQEVYAPIPATDIDFYTNVAVEQTTTAYELDLYATFTQNVNSQVVGFKIAKQLQEKRRTFYSTVQEVLEGKKEETRFYIRRGSDVSKLKSQMAYHFKCFPFKIYPNGISTWISGPKAGKTLHIITAMLEAVRAGFHVLAFDLENGIDQYEKRLHQALLGVDSYCIESGKMVDRKRLDAADILEYQEKQTYVEDDVVWVYNHTKEDSDVKAYGFVQGGTWSTDVRVYKARQNINWGLNNIDESCMINPKGLLKEAADFPNGHWQDVTAAYKHHVSIMDINPVLEEALYKLGAESGGQLVIKYLEKGTPEQMYTSMHDFAVNQVDGTRSWKVDFKAYAKDNGLDLTNSDCTPYLGLISTFEDSQWSPHKIGEAYMYEELCAFAQFLKLKKIPDNKIDLIYALLDELNTTNAFFSDPKRRLMVVDWFNLMTPDENVKEHYKQFQYIMRGLQTIRKRIEGLSQIVVEGVTNKADLAIEDYKELDRSTISSSGTKKNDYDVVYRGGMLYSDKHHNKSVRTYITLLDRYGGGQIGFSFIDNLKQQIHEITEEEFELRMFSEEPDRGEEDVSEAADSFLTG